MNFNCLEIDLWTATRRSFYCLDVTYIFAIFFYRKLQSSIWPPCTSWSHRSPGRRSWRCSTSWASSPVTESTPPVWSFKNGKKNYVCQIICVLHENILFLCCFFFLICSVKLRVVDHHELCNYNDGKSNKSEIFHFVLIQLINVKPLHVKNE